MQSNAKKHTRTVALLTGLVALTACASEPGVYGTFFNEAGAQLETGDFGRATLHNQLVQTCKSNGTGFAKGKGGAGAGDAVVVLDPKSTLNNPVYRVHCDGRLDGKYATVIYNEYVGSAVQKDSVEDASVE